ncbi:hypothetical protein CSKR_100540 [Clonorchis sinensis]|uniref:Uncharacterized protein n=1 Tax=Clonorchis sinensis TaxID=79923 RepID=A0A419PZQ9_CLOSI|nr:hypothetical protein CSKR_100540 [Clonorchis sinensis]
MVNKSVGIFKKRSNIGQIEYLEVNASNTKVGEGSSPKTIAWLRLHPFGGHWYLKLRISSRPPKVDTDLKGHVEKVVDVDQKQQWFQKRALSNSNGDRQRRRDFPLNPGKLGDCGAAGCVGLDRMLLRNKKYGIRYKSFPISLG